MHQIWGYFASEVSRSSPKQASFIVGYYTILTTFQLFCTNPAHFTFLTTSRVVVRHHASRNVFAWMSYWQKAAGPPKPAQSLQLTDFLLYEQTEKEKNGKKMRWCCLCLHEWPGVLTGHGTCCGLQSGHPTSLLVVKTVLFAQRVWGHNTQNTVGDFNHCKLELVLPGFEQCVDCSTRNNEVWICYGNVHQFYIAKFRCLLANSDIYRIPTCETVLKSSKPRTKAAV